MSHPSSATPASSRPPPLEPITTLIALVVAAGFAWAKSQRSPSESRKAYHELDYKPPKIINSSKGRAAEFDLAAIDVLSEYLVVQELVQQGFPLIFVTGSAGTGKSTFIRWMQHVFDGECLVAAPTGMAAVNIDGQTLHRLCTLPPAFILEPDIKYNARRIEVRRAKVLIIDEISMVNANLLDATSAFLKKNRSDDRPFGGLPVVVVGDLFQLPPIVTRDVRELFARHYGTAHFFNARSIQASPYYAVELSKAFRQSEQHFVDLLANVRIARDLETTVAAINRSCAIQTEAPQGAVHLSPRNAEVDAINARKLESLGGAEKTYESSITGDYKRDRIPAPSVLRLRVGAQVMFVKNGRRGGWVNGSIGIVRSLGPNEVTVELESGATTTVTAESWESFKYEWNDSEGRIERRVTGTFTQIPLTLGWAITIHKSQGKTLERVHLDLGGGAFETGQTYVALSRCRTMQGLTLSRPLKVSDVMVDRASKMFYLGLVELMKNMPPEQMRASIRSTTKSTGRDVATSTS